jgi:quercetin dioxygenase-like cupin family protein
VPAQRIFKISMADIPSNERRGGDLRTVLSPATVPATAGFLGVATIGPGEAVSEHYHPYSEEFLFLVRGELAASLDGEPCLLRAGDGLFIPKRVRHRLLNIGHEPAFAVFHLAPLAPRPELGHVDVEQPATAAHPGEGNR